MKLSKGFTIIELIVVMAVFLFVIGIAISIFLSIIKNQKEVLSEQQFLNQISYAQEYMSKALRMAKTAEDDSCIPTGYIYLLTRPNISNGFYQGIKFINQSNNNICQEFFLEGDILKEQKGEGLPVDLSSSNLKVNYARFIINGSNIYTSASNCISGDLCIQPKVTILLNIEILGGDDNGLERTIQTTISRRNLNVQQQ